MIPGNYYSASELINRVALDDLQNIEEWGLDSSNLRFGFLPIEYFEKQILEMIGTFDEFPEDEERVQNIVHKIKNNKTIFPVFVEEQDFSYFVVEGRHRLVAMYLTNQSKVPILFAKKKSA